VDPNLDPKGSFTPDAAPQRDATQRVALRHIAYVAASGVNEP